MAKVEAFRGWWEGASEAVRADAEADSRRNGRGIRQGVHPPRHGRAAGRGGGVRGNAALGVRRVRGDAPGEDRILALHAGIFRNSPAGRLQAGRYKTASAESTFLRWGVEPVTLREPGPLLVPAQMETLSAWFDSRIGGNEFHPLLVAAAYLLEFLAIRPFAEGNHRTGRLLDEPPAAAVRAYLHPVRLPRQGRQQPTGRGITSRCGRARPAATCRGPTSPTTW